MSKSIVLTGGGSAGHITPNIALLDGLKEKGYDISYIGSYTGMEKGLIEGLGIPYTGIATGKFRRYFDLKNFSDPFRVVKGYFEARKTLKELHPDVVFSKGGFVSVPVVRAAASLKIPCIIHESDMSPGLANKLCFPVAKKVCCSFPETIQSLPAEKAVLTGSPIRADLLTGDAAKGREMCGFDTSRPVLMIIGGSLGAAAINACVREALPKLLPDFQVVHICGKEKIDNLLLNTEGYVQFEYLTKELSDIFAMADVVISRAGANAICELAALKKPNLLIPLTAGSRGDQVLNAESFASQGFSLVLNQDDMTVSTLISKVHELYENRETYISAMEKGDLLGAADRIVELIDQVANG